MLLYTKYTKNKHADIGVVTSPPIPPPPPPQYSPQSLSPVP